MLRLWHRAQVLSIAALVYSFAKPAACAFSDRFSPRQLAVFKTNLGHGGSTKTKEANCWYSQPRRSNTLAMALEASSIELQHTQDGNAKARV
eukprot:5836696-Amphidinium_carterae.1